MPPGRSWYRSRREQEGTEIQGLSTPPLEPSEKIFNVNEKIFDSTITFVFLFVCPYLTFNFVFVFEDLCTCVRVS